MRLNARNPLDLCNFRYFLQSARRFLRSKSSTTDFYCPSFANNTDRKQP